MKHHYSILISILSLMFFTATPAFCQEITFNKVKAPVGNPFIFITGITQDVRGIMWFSSKSGLISYDGNLVTAFRNNPMNPNSIMSNTLESIFADPDGSIWIGSLGQGLDNFDPASGKFTHYTHNPKSNTSLVNDTVTQILRDKQGTLWIGTHGGLDRFDQKTNTFFHYRNNAKDTKSLSNNQVRVLYEDRHGTLWIGTGSPFTADGGSINDGGLNRMDKYSGTFTRFLHDPVKNNSLVSNKVSAIYEDTQGIIWVGTARNGFHKMNLPSETFERISYDPTHPEKLCGPSVHDESVLYENIRFISQDAAGSYWIGSSHAGLNYYNPVAGKCVHYEGNSNPSVGFTDNGVWSAFSSRDGIFWIGCPDPGGNIYRINPFRKEIPHIPAASGYVNCIFEQAGGTLLLGTDHGLISEDKEFVKLFQAHANLSKTTDNNIRKIIKDRQGDIWIAGFKGLTRWDHRTNKFSIYKNEPGNPNSLSNSGIFQLWEDKDDKLWVGSLMGLNSLDRKTGLFTRYFIYPEDTAAWGKNFVTSFCQDKKGRFWLSAWSGGGINLFDRAKKQFKTYLKGVSIVLVYEDTDGTLWACAQRGLYKFDEVSDNFTRFNDPMSLIEIPDIYNMVEDNDGNLWLGTSDGILRINSKRDELKLFGKNYGVGNNGMSYGGSYKGKDGKLYFGDGKGYFLFDPAQLVKGLKLPVISMTGFRLGDQVIRPGDGGPLKKSLLYTKEIRLRYNQNFFSFDLSVIDYTDPDQNQLFYMLENFETSWHQANSDRTAYYFNIPPGKYVFLIKAVNGNGVWAEKTIEVIILPPWWRSWWAYGFYALLVIASVFAFDRFMRRRIVLAERKRTQERELVHAKEIEKAYTELKETQTQLIQSEKMASLGELTAGIAHEIQNPLNFVNNFSEVNSELITELQEERKKDVRDFENEDAILNDIKENEQKINHHGRRADAIVKGMLQHSRSSTGVKEPANINVLADEYLRLAYHGLRAMDKSFNATMKTDFDESIGNINIIPQDVGRVILNLITNAFYAVTEKKQQLPVGYEPTVSVTTHRSNGKVEIKVADNGNGIPQKVLDKIYQPFFTTKPSGQGTGLGLSMSYEIVTKGHGGELKVDTKEGEGAEFTIILPV